MTIKQVILAILYIGVVTCEPTPIGACPDGSPTPDSIQMLSPLGTLCKESSCVVYGGKALAINMTFTSSDYVENLKPRVYALAADVTIEWPGLGTDGCSMLTTSLCPIVPDEPVEYYQELSIQKIFPEISVHLTFLLEDTDNAKNVTCFTYDIVVNNS